MTRTVAEIRRLLLVLAMLAGVAPGVSAQTDSVSPGALLTYSTIYSVGVEWDVVNDADHDATATLEYRAAGAAQWRAAGALVRVDYNGRNMLAGSMLFLSPGTEYEVRVSLSDPDGGGDTRLLVVQTRGLPTAPSGGRVFYVMPGVGGGDGSPQAPFQGVAAAEAAAQPGDTLLLHAGGYGPIRFSKPGTTARYIAWKALGDGDVAMDGVQVAASHIWLEGLTIANQTYGMLSANAPTNVVVTRCTFVNNEYGIFLTGGGSGWYIADNSIVGRTPTGSGSLAGEGIDLNVTNGHTVAHNSITRVADGISAPRLNVDIFGNDIFDTADDGVELDEGLSNVRVWGNRIHNAVHNGISFQPQNSGPWYIVRNQIVNNAEAAFKFRTTDRFVLLHNTIVSWGTAWTDPDTNTSMMCCNEDHLLRAYARNNLWISVQGGRIWGFDGFTRDWRTDLDYDGFDWGRATDPFTYGSWTYPDVWSFASASGLETHGIHVVKETCFEDLQIPGPPPAPVPPHVLTLRPGCNAIDAGAILPNVNDGFFGAAPDIGAHEYGGPPARYGPRPELIGPAAPTWLTAAAVSSTRIDLRWIDNSGSETGFRIERSLDAQVFTIIGTVGANTVAYSATGLSAGTTYFFRVAAFNGAGLSPTSNVASATTTAVTTPFGGTARALPGRVEAEHFDDGGEGIAYHDTTMGNTGGSLRNTDVDLEGTTDAGGGYNVGWMMAGEWLTYTVSVAQSGTYTLTARVAAEAAGGTFHVEFGGVNKTGPLTIPATGAWQSWTNVTATVTLGAGVQPMRVVADSNGPTGVFVGNLNWVGLVAAGAAPFGGTARALPGRVEAEHFDDGGEGIAYHDTTVGNTGGSLRNTDVDLEGTTDAGGGYNVGWMTAGEWLTYTVSVAQSGTYTLTARVAAQAAGGTFHVEFGGVDKTGPLTIPNTGAWQTWTNVTATVTLGAGVQSMRVVADRSGPTGVFGNLNWVGLVAAGPAPFGGTARALPGRVEAEHFDDGGEGIAYHDTTVGNTGGSLRNTDVDLQGTTDAGGGYNVAWITAGEWLTYTVSVAQSGTYTLTARVAAKAAGGTFHIEFGGVNKTGPLTIPNTGTYQTWANVTATVTLGAGVQSMRVVADSSGPTGVFGNLNWLELAASGW